MNKKICLLILVLQMISLYQIQASEKKLIKIKKNTIVYQIPTIKFLDQKHLEDQEKYEFSEYESDALYYGALSESWIKEHKTDFQYIVSQADLFMFFKIKQKNTEEYGFWIVTKKEIVFYNTVNFFETYVLNSE